MLYIIIRGYYRASGLRLSRCRVSRASCFIRAGLGVLYPLTVIKERKSGTMLLLYIYYMGMMIGLAWWVGVPLAYNIRTRTRGELPTLKFIRNLSKKIGKGY